MAIPLLPLYSNIEDDDIDDDANLRALVAGGNSGRSAEASTAQPSKLKSPKKGGKKVDGHVTCSLIPDVVLELGQSDAASERGHVVIAIENPNPDLDVKIVVRFGVGVKFILAGVDFTVHLSCICVSSKLKFK